MTVRGHIERVMQRLWIVLGAVNIRVKILGIVLGMVFLLGFTVIIQVRQLLAQSMYVQLEEQAVSIARDLAARAVDPILINNLYGLQQLLLDTKAVHPSVRYAFIKDKQGYVIAHTFGDGFPLGLLLANRVALNDYQHTEVLNTDQGMIWDVAVPIFEGRAGTARVGMSDSHVIQTINVISGQLMLTTALVSAVGISAAVLLTWVLTRPILTLLQATQAVERGDFSQVVPRWANDEIGELSAAFNAMTAALAKSESERAEREQLRDQYVNGFISAQEEERKRIARELHDSTSQSLSSLMIGLRALSDSLQAQPSMAQALDELRAIAAQTLDEIHLLARQLRPSVLDDMGLAQAIKRHISDCQRQHGLTIDLLIHGLEDDRRLAPMIETALYRIVQEGLTNIVRHAQAETASVVLESTDDKVLLIIEDDGQGFDIDSLTSQEEHLGLHGIRERAALLNGTLVIESAPGLGTSLYIEIPLHEKAKP